jgi:precorrin-3B methylase
VWRTEKCTDSCEKARAVAFFTWAHEHAGCPCTCAADAEAAAAEAAASAAELAALAAARAARAAAAAVAAPLEDDFQFLPMDAQWFDLSDPVFP